MSMDVFSELKGIEEMLDFHVQRHGVLAGNLANADTPGYQAQDLTFQGALGSLENVQTTHDKHIGMHSSGSSSVTELEPSPSVDGNGVQVQHTLAQVTANRLRYEEALELAKRRLALMRYGATDGGSA